MTTLLMELDPQTDLTPGRLSADARVKKNLPRVALLLFALLTLALGFASNGEWLDDDLCHYQMARSSWHDPRMLLNGWGRPGCTLPYAMVAGIGSMATGFRAARLLTALMGTLTVLLTWKTARKIHAPFAWLAPLIMLFMPEFFGESFTPCTEIPTALYTIVGTYFLARGNRRWGAVFFAILPATRHELAPFLLPLGIYFLWRRDFLAALLLGWFEGAWALASWEMHQPQPIFRYFTPQDATAYGSGHFYHYFLCWLKMAGAVTVILCLTGAWVIGTHERAAGFKKWNRPGPVGRRHRVRLLAVGGTLGLVLLETVLFSFNRFASGGYSTFLVPAAPLMALCACYGIGPCVRRVSRPVALACLVIAAVHLGFYLHPYRQSGHQKLIGTVIAQLHRDDPDCHIIGDSTWITYFDEISPGARELCARDTWYLNTAPHLYYIHNFVDGMDPTMKDIDVVPNQRIKSAKVSESDAMPDLVIYRRLP